VLKKVAHTRLPSVGFRSWSRQPADVSHKPGGWLPLLSARPTVTPTTLKKAATNFAAWWIEAQWVWTLCLRLTRQRSYCDLNPGPSAPESSTLTTRLRVLKRHALKSVVNWLNCIRSFAPNLWPFVYDWTYCTWWRNKTVSRKVVKCSMM